MNSRQNRSLLSTLLVVAAVALLWPIYQTPVWWVSLEAPNYPPETYPDGVRILFQCNGVFSGCASPDQTEIRVEEAVDCVQEMDTINHYVGMYPIAAGGPLELFFSLFLLALVAVMLLAALVPGSRRRTAIMGVGFAGIVVWMGIAYYSEGGLRLHSARYLEGRITVLGEIGEIGEIGEAGADAAAAEGNEETEMTPGEALIARLKASLAESNDKQESVAQVAEAAPAPTDGKSTSLAYLRDAYEQDRGRQSTDGQEWRGSGAQLLAWHYEKSLGRYFRDQAVLGPMSAGMARGGNIMVGGIVAAMLGLLVLASRNHGRWRSVLLLAPAGLPLFFVVEYSAWLWWYGHHMSEMGAFTLKAFMPTVFGLGKVAQFTTNSYPALGFWLMVLFAALLVAAALLRREPAPDQSGK
jgi:hypothetical protein